MDWNTLLSTALIVLFIVLMLRGCGGMMSGGGCGMGKRPRRDRAPQAGEAEGHRSRGPERS